MDAGRVVEDEHALRREVHAVIVPGGSGLTESGQTLKRLVLGGGGGGRPDYLQKLKVPVGYEKMIDYSNI